ncbi:MAG TPA: hypothetical protein VGN42_08080 [Pirellulales bacterium]|jgi:hypothetical protein|nr:hypothetical protein [Pirellulales bacterium]
MPTCPRSRRANNFFSSVLKALRIELRRHLAELLLLGLGREELTSLIALLE